MSKQMMNAQAHALRSLVRWPKDPTRPALQLQDVLRTRLEKPSMLSEPDQWKQANALYSLLDDRFKNKYSIAGSLMQPRSNPSHYTDLIRDLEEAPKRSWFNRMLIRIRGMVRLS